MTVFEFLKSRPKLGNNLYLAPGGSNRTVMISSYIWWTELLAHALIKLGCNVLVAEPMFWFFSDSGRHAHFEQGFESWLKALREFKIQLIIGGNTTVMVPHMKSREMLHKVAGVPAVNFWWDEPRAMPPFARKGNFSAAEYLEYLRDPSLLNVFWDGDVMEEMRRFFQVENSAHVPLGTTPEFWETDLEPMKDRPLRMCFLGNNHLETDWLEGQSAETVEWAQRVMQLKLADLDRSTADCIEQIGSPGRAGQFAVASDLFDEFQRWNIFGGMLLRDCRNAAVTAAAKHLGSEFVLIGTGWERLGLTPVKDHGGIPDSRAYYAKSQASMNLSGGCVHAGMPLRPYEIACSGGLLFTQYSRELPGLFEPGKECITFRNAEEMIDAWEKIRAAPSEFDSVVQAGKRRAIVEHTWEKRMARILDLAKEQFDLPW